MKSKKWIIAYEYEIKIIYNYDLLNRIEKSNRKQECSQCLLYISKTRNIKLLKLKSKWDMIMIMKYIY